MWTGVAALLAAGVVIGLGKTCQAVSGWREDVGREKAPWERGTDDVG